MKTQISPVIVAVVVVALLAVLGYFGWYSMTPHPPAGVKYTPGVPPWMDKSGGPKIPGQPAGPGGPPVISPKGDLGGR